MSPIVLGIDLGTSGMRIAALDLQGELQAEVSHRWTQVETDPRQWIQVMKHLLERVKLGLAPDQIPVAISACSTSGTILAVDDRGNPQTEAWLYSDPRGQDQAKHLGISSSWGLCRWLWWAQTEPEQYANSYLAHPTDVLLTALGAEPRVTDHTCALKSGFDLLNYRWFEKWQKFGLDLERFPRVVAPGTPIGSVNAEWGLGPEVKLIAGCTDGCAGQLASGAAAPGQISTSLGTTLIFKGTSTDRIQTEDGRVYSHLHPDRRAWLPGAASSCGGGVLDHHFPSADLRELDRLAAHSLPTGQICYPLWQVGERFPISDPEFEGFFPPDKQDSSTFYAALLEGVALVERLGLEHLQDLGLEVNGPVFTTGGGNRSPLWLEIRASVLNRELSLARYPQPAVGAAMLAAAGAQDRSVQETVQTLAQEERRIGPRPEWIASYDEIFTRFRHRLGLADPRIT